jgi:general secretion pathway protein G
MTQVLLERKLMKRRVRFVSLIALGVALATGCSAQQKREATLKDDLLIIRQAIDKYTLDKEQAPHSLQDLVKEHYLKEIPTDPFTEKKDWVPQFDEVVLSPQQSSTGMVDIHSASGSVGSNGVAYSEW